MRPVDFFSAHPDPSLPLRLLQDVGLGYLTLGSKSDLVGRRSATDKLVTGCRRFVLHTTCRNAVRAAGGRKTLYVLDEPTVGLHMADVEKLIRVLHRLVDAVTRWS